jgi:hypothetical protein
VLLLAVKGADQTGLAHNHDLGRHQKERRAAFLNQHNATEKFVLDGIYVMERSTMNKLLLSQYWQLTFEIQKNYVFNKLELQTDYKNVSNIFAPKKAIVIFQFFSLAPFVFCNFLCILIEQKKFGGGGCG